MQLDSASLRLLEGHDRNIAKEKSRRPEKPTHIDKLRKTVTVTVKLTIVNSNRHF